MIVTGISPVTLDQIIGLERYEAVRDELRREIIGHKRHRRVAVGDDVTFVFENHATVYFQIQEMLRAERITDLDAVREELEVYNALLPQPGQLSATMLIEIVDQEHVAERLLRLLGIDESVRLEIGDRFVVRGEFEPGRSREDRLSAVQYVRFSLPAPARAAFTDASLSVRLRIDHPNYRAATELSAPVRASLAEDLGTPA
jgi:hypothetical protein